MPDETAEPMKSRIEYREMAPGAIKGMLDMAKYVRSSGLDNGLVELIEIRASQINGWNRLSVAFRRVPGS